MKVKDLQPGDIIATASPKGFLPKGIRFFMRRWAKKHYGFEPERYYNHTFMVLESGSDPKIVEAVGRGLTGHRMFEQYEREDLKNMVVLRTRESWTEQEIRLLREKADEMAYRNIEYEFLNFLWWMVYILTNGKTDLAPKGEKAGKRLFCFELSVILLNAAKKMFADPSHVNTVDLQADRRFTQLFFDKELNTKTPGLKEEVYIIKHKDTRTQRRNSKTPGLKEEKGIKYPPEKNNEHARTNKQPES